MEKFKCYGYHKPYTEEKCTTQCVDCERKEILEKSGTFKITPMMEEIIREEEEKQSNKKYSKDEMLLFGGFCIGRRATAPGISGSELWNEWTATFGKNG